MNPETIQFEIKIVYVCGRGDSTSPRFEDAFRRACKTDQGFFVSLDLIGNPLREEVYRVFGPERASHCLMAITQQVCTDIQRPEAFYLRKLTLEQVDPNLTIRNKAGDAAVAKREIVAEVLGDNDSRKPMTTGDYVRREIDDMNAEDGQG